MGLRKTKSEREAVARMKAADKALNENGEREKRAGIRHETPEYLQLNKAANEAAAEVSFRFGGTRKGR